MKERGPGWAVAATDPPSPRSFKFLQAFPAVIFAVDRAGDRSVEHPAVKVAKGLDQLVDWRREDFCPGVDMAGSEFGNQDRLHRRIMRLMGKPKTVL